MASHCWVARLHRIDFRLMPRVYGGACAQRTGNWDQSACRLVLLGRFYFFFIRMQKQLLSDFLQLGFDFGLVLAPYPHENPLAYGASF